MPPRQSFEISWETLWRVLFFVVLVAVLYLGRQIILGMFLAIVISSGLEVFINFFERRGVPRTLGVIFIFVLAALLFAVLIYLIIPFVIADLSLVLNNFGESPLGIWLSPVLEFKASQSISDWAGNVSGKLLAGGFPKFGSIAEVLGGAGLGIAVVAIAFYLSLSRNGVERFLRAVIPEENEDVVLRVYARSVEKISYWFRAQILLSFMVGTLVWLALFLLGVRHSLLLGILAGVFEIVPFVGPILAGATALLFAFVSSQALAFYTLMVFLAIQQFESHVLVPLVTKRAVGLHPVVVIIALLIGAKAGGLLGILASVPAAAVFQEILEDHSLRKIKKTN